MKFELRKSNASQGFQFHFTLFLISQNILKEPEKNKEIPPSMCHTPATGLQSPASSVAQRRNLRTLAQLQLKSCALGSHHHVDSNMHHPPIQFNIIYRKKKLQTMSGEKKKKKKHFNSTNHSLFKNKPLQGQPLPVSSLRPPPTPYQTSQTALAGP